MACTKFETIFRQMGFSASLTLPGCRVVYTLCTFTEHYVVSAVGAQRSVRFMHKLLGEILHYVGGAPAFFKPNSYTT